MAMDDEINAFTDSHMGWEWGDLDPEMFCYNCSSPSYAISIYIGSTRVESYSYSYSYSYTCNAI